MTYLEAESKLLSALEKPLQHHHVKWIKRHFSKWEPYYDPEEGGRLTWILQDPVQVPCPTRLVAFRPSRVERERTDLKTRVVASRQFQCAAPSVGKGPASVIMYAALEIGDESPV